MKINAKTQTSRSTQWKEDFNCVNLFLADRFANSAFSVGLQVTEWGEKQEIEPAIIFEANGKHYRYTIAEFVKLLV